jgi:gas vesicle protein
MNAKSLIGGLLAGAAVGVAVGMLLAPDSGAKTQQKLVKGARKLGDDLMRTAGSSFQSVKDRFNTKVDEVADRGREGITRSSEKIKV